jgi:hypothetical protein
MKKSIRLLMALISAVMLMVSICSLAVWAYVPAAPPQPAYIEPGDSPPTIVDGDPGEWNLADDGTGDFFAEMYNAGNPDQNWPGYAVLSKLYLRYDCSTHILYALVLKEPDVTALEQPEDAWLKLYDMGWSNDKLIDGNGEGNTTPRGFEWVYQVPGDDTSTLLGYEAYASLSEGSHDLEAHLQVNPDDRTSSTGKDGIDLNIICVPTPIKLDSFTAKASHGQVNLAWDTGTGVDSAGFNLYRALLKDGPYTKINEAFITAGGEAVSGASYSFLDAPDYGTFYYKLEEVDLYGMSTLYGPVKVTVARPLRRPLYRPRLPEF